jgi:hypothetical protein
MAGWSATMCPCPQCARVHTQTQTQSVLLLVQFGLSPSALQWLAHTVLLVQFGPSPSALQWLTHTVLLVQFGPSLSALQWLTHTVLTDVTNKQNCLQQFNLCVWLFRIPISRDRQGLSFVWGFC